VCIAPAKSKKPSITSSNSSPNWICSIRFLAKSTANDESGHRILVRNRTDEKAIAMIISPIVLGSFKNRTLRNPNNADRVMMIAVI